MIDSAIMTQDRWDALTDADRVMLKSLGICPQEVKVKAKKETNPITLERRMSTRNTAGQEYYTVILRTCGCCRTTVRHEGKMMKRRASDSYLSLEFMEIPAGEVFKQQKVVSVVCPDCDKELDKLSKEELIVMVKTLREIAAKKCTI
jgi:hypothetical protein